MAGNGIAGAMGANGYAAFMGSFQTPAIGLGLRDLSTGNAAAVDPQIGQSANVSQNSGDPATSSGVGGIGSTTPASNGNGPKPPSNALYVLPAGNLTEDQKAQSNWFQDGNGNYYKLDSSKNDASQTNLMGRQMWTQQGDGYKYVDTTRILDTGANATVTVEAEGPWDHDIYGNPMYSRHTSSISDDLARFFSSFNADKSVTFAPNAIIDINNGTISSVKRDDTLQNLPTWAKAIFIGTYVVDGIGAPMGAAHSGAPMNWSRASGQPYQAPIESTPNALFVKPSYTPPAFRTDVSSGTNANFVFGRTGTSAPALSGLGTTYVSNGIEAQARGLLESAGVPFASRSEIINSFNLDSLRIQQTTSAINAFRNFDDYSALLQGRYASTDLFMNQTNAIQNLALMNNSATRLGEVTIPIGSTIFTGTAAPQPNFSPGLTGGANQIFLTGPLSNYTFNEIFRPR